jgi:uncharacterized protein
MRRFESTSVVAARTPAGGGLELWVAEGFGARLAGIAGLSRLPPGRGLLLPRCASVHTVGMRFAIDVAFVTWPPRAGACEVVWMRSAVPPLRIVSRRGDLAALEAAAGELVRAGVGAGARIELWPSGRVLP